MKLNSSIFVPLLSLAFCFAVLTQVSIAEEGDEHMSMTSTSFPAAKQTVATKTFPAHADAPAPSKTETPIDQANLVETVCQNSPHKDFCISTLQSDPISKDADVTGLAVIALVLAKANAANTTVQIKQMLNNGTEFDPFVEQCLNECADHYADVVDQIDDSIAAVSVKAYRDVFTWTKAAIDDIQSCEDSFKEQPGHPLVLAHQNKALRQLCNNALVVAKNLPGTGDH